VLSMSASYVSLITAVIWRAAQTADTTRPSVAMLLFSLVALTVALCCASLSFVRHERDRRRALGLGLAGLAVWLLAAYA
jgi:hypothetical protein